MAYFLKRNGKLAIEKETVEGVYQGNPASGSFIKANAEGVTMNKSKEELTQEFLGDGIGMTEHKQGLTTSTASVGMPMAAGATEGAKSPASDSLESLLGSMRVYATSTCTSATATVLTIPGHTYKKGDVLIIKEEGLFEARPVASVAGDDVTLKWALSATPSATVAVAAVRVAAPAEDGHPSLSITRFYGDDADAICEKSWGNKCISVSADNFVTGQLADLTFGYEGLGYEKINLAPNAQTYSQAERSAILGAFVFQNGSVFKINEFGFSIQNTLAAISDTKEGKTSLKVVRRETTGTINPYQLDTSAGLSQYTNFDQNLPFSLFVVHSNPTATDGENANWTCFWMPKCKITALEEGDYNGIVTENLSFRAYVSDDEKEVYIAQS